MLKHEKFFNDNYELDLEQDLIDVASHLQIESFSPRSTVINYGELGDKFYIVLKGVVKVLIPNDTIPDRAVKWKNYMFLKDWKRDVYDVSVVKAEKEFMACQKE